MNGPSCGPNQWDPKLPRHANVHSSIPYGKIHTVFVYLETMKIIRMIIAQLHNTNNKHLIPESQNTNTLLFNPLQQSHFDITQEEVLLFSYDIRRAWLRTAELYIGRVTDQNDLARGSHAQHILHHTSGRPPDTLDRQ
jgi:hypothetical protein